MLAAELGTAAYVQADLAQDEDRIRLVREATAKWRRLDVLVNNAASAPHNDLAAATPQIWQELYEVKCDSSLPPGDGGRARFAGSRP